MHKILIVFYLLCFKMLLDYHINKTGNCFENITINNYKNIRINRTFITIESECFVIIEDTNKQQNNIFDYNIMFKKENFDFDFKNKIFRGKNADKISYYQKRRSNIAYIHIFYENILLCVICNSKKMIYIDNYIFTTMNNNLVCMNSVFKIEYLLDMENDLYMILIDAKDQENIMNKITIFYNNNFNLEKIDFSHWYYNNKKLCKYGYFIKGNIIAASFEHDYFALIDYKINRDRYEITDIAIYDDCKKISQDGFIYPDVKQYKLAFISKNLNQIFNKNTYFLYHKKLMDMLVRDLPKK